MQSKVMQQAMAKGCTPLAYWDDLVFIVQIFYIFW